MKAAVLHKLGSTPVYEDFDEPEVKDDQQILITVTAASVKNIDKTRAGGSHYASHTELPVVVGIDGVGKLENGTRVYASGITGMLAEKALADKNKCIQIPENIDDATAAALPNAVLGSALALRYRALLQPKDTVIVNGATGVTGKVAVQIAKLYGAGKVIATGRNEQSLEELRMLGADEVISLQQSEKDFIAAIKKIHQRSPINSVIDYLWGRPAEMILASLAGKGIAMDAHTIRFVSIGGMAGEQIQLDSASLRSAAIEISGSGFGSLPKDAFSAMNNEILPEALQMAAAGRLKIDTITEPLSNIENAWNAKTDPGKRLVIII